MNRNSMFTRGLPLLGLLLLVSPVFVSPVFATSGLTTYSDVESFLAAAGPEALDHVNFDQFESGTRIADQISGVVFTSPNSELEGSEAINALANSSAVSQPNILTGGMLRGTGSSQIIVMTFDTPITGFGFYLTGYNPSATPALVRFDFSNGTNNTIPLSNNSESESNPVFLGVICPLPISSVTIIAGNEGDGFEEFGIDDLYFGQAETDDVTPPVCSGAPATIAGVLGIDGMATDTTIITIDSPVLSAARKITPTEIQSGITSVALREGSTNVTLTVTPFDPGAPSVSFRVEPTNPALNGSGTVVATDGFGNLCTLPATFRALGPGPLTDQVLCTADGLLFQVSNGSGTPSGASACSATLPGGDEPAFPPGYSPSPADDPFPCRVLTIDSPVSGSTDMTLKKDGEFEPNLRMLYSHGTVSGSTTTYGPFADVTTSVDQIATITPDPTRVRGTGSWSPVKISCGTISEEARLDYCAGLAGGPGPDADGDGYTLCGSASSAADCSDQRAFIHPGASETCNGLDDNCNGTADEDHPTAGAGAACAVVQSPALLGACATGETSCANGPMSCVQTHFPVPEIACNGADDDCNGSTDEVYVFNGYLAPIKASGTTAFMKKRGAIPVKFALTDCSGRSIPNAVATIEVHFVANGEVSDDPIDIGSVGSANTGNRYRYDPDGRQYVYNLDASSLLSNAFYLIRTRIDDGTTHDVIIAVK